MTPLVARVTAALVLLVIVDPIAGFAGYVAGHALAYLVIVHRSLRARAATGDTSAALAKEKPTKLEKLDRLVPALGAGFRLPPTDMLEAATVDGKKVRLFPNGRWEYVDAAMAAEAPQTATEVAAMAARSGFSPMRRARA